MIFLREELFGEISKKVVDILLNGRYTIKRTFLECSNYRLTTTFE